MAMRRKILRILWLVLLDAGLVVTDQYLNDINCVGVKAVVDWAIGATSFPFYQRFQDLLDRSYWQEQRRRFERS